MTASSDEKRYDVRVMDFHLREGTYSKEELDGHLSGLMDSAEEAEPTETVFSPTFELRHAETDEEGGETDLNEN